MVTEDKVKNLIEDFNKNHREKTFAEFIATLYADKFVEIYLGDSYEEVSLEQTSTSYPAVFCGKIVAAFKECLVIDSFYADKTIRNTRKIKQGNIVFINERAIRGLTEIDGNGIMEDMFLRSRESLDIKETFVDKK